MELKLKQDIYEYGHYQQGCYKGVEWSMKRHPKDKYWCGYVHFKGEINEPLQELIDDTVYMGPAFMRTGFDCNHICDYPANKKGVYKDYYFVLGVIKNVIDVIQENN